MKQPIIAITFICILMISTCLTDRSDRDARLFQAAEHGNVHAVRTLLADGADANVSDQNGTPALFLASQNGHTEVVRLLLAAGAEVGACGIEPPSLYDVPGRRREARGSL